MKTLYLDLGMGAAGDMLTAALLELLEDKAAFLSKLQAAGIPGVSVEALPAEKCGITGTQMRVLVDGVEEEVHEHHHHDHGHDHEHHHHDHEHHHHGLSMPDIEAMVQGLNVSEKVKSDVLAVYGLIADAESKAHGKPVAEVHFHEVGMMDAIADITAVCMLLETIAPDRILASPVNTGSGHVHCAHGILPVPAPATAHILQGVPTYAGHVQSELCTPTGAALLKHFVSEFKAQPVLRVQAIGYGMGKKDFEQANCVRAMLGEDDDLTETLCELSFNVDDMTAEAIAFACDKLFEAGAREVFTIPVTMKKSRPGTLVKMICLPEQKASVIEAVFRHTSTLGVREHAEQRNFLKRHVEEVQTPLGTVRIKRSEGYGVTKAKAEFDDIARIASEQDLPLEEVRKLAETL